MKKIDRENLVARLQEQDNGTGVFTRRQIIDTAESLGLGFPAWLVNGRKDLKVCLLYTSPSPRDRTRSRMPSSA